ncbi:MAG: hypothetical protein U9P36_05865 [Thermodesulfobacteriota bacterium]|nr:hypothetical protein [Thermodesulfobacteriota bacterium]
MQKQTVIFPDRLRRIPKQFSWVDGRLVRDQHLDRCSHPAAALYLFLITVADAQGLSYYSDRTIEQRLRMDAATLAQIRLELIEHCLIAYRKPLYQVLDLAEPVQITTIPRNRPEDMPKSFGEIMRHVMEGAGNHD